MIEEGERAKMLKAHSIGPRMITYLDEIGIQRLSDLRGADAEELAMRIDIAFGRKHMNRLGVDALRNLIALAERDRPLPSECRQSGQRHNFRHARACPGHLPHWQRDRNI